MKLNDKHMLILVLIVAILLYSNDLCKGKYYYPILKSFKIVQMLSSFKSGMNLGSLMRINKSFNSKKNTKILNDIIKNYNSKKNNEKKNQDKNENEKLKNKKTKSKK
jgi:uncharacterized sodium:solute symporter family permease YidK